MGLTTLLQCGHMQMGWESNAKYGHGRDGSKVGNLVDVMDDPALGLHSNKHLPAAVFFIYGYA